jgi:tRNA(Phe) wybutosine-synthesizing methylase Tyw3
MNSNEIITEYGLDALAAVLHETAREKGFWDKDTDINFILSKIALIHSEGSELLEALRKEKGQIEIVYEIVDILIRTLDLYAALRNEGIVLKSLDEALHEKHSININRPYKHGTLA